MIMCFECKYNSNCEIQKALECMACSRGEPIPVVDAQEAKLITDYKHEGDPK